MKECRGRQFRMHIHLKFTNIENAESFSVFSLCQNSVSVGRSCQNVAISFKGLKTRKHAIDLTHAWDVFGAILPLGL